MSMRRIKEIKWGAAALALLAVGAGVGWWAHRMMQTPPAMSATHEAPPNSASDKRKILYWHDPMVPNVKFDKPGQVAFHGYAARAGLCGRGGSRR